MKGRENDVDIESCGWITPTTGHGGLLIGDRLDSTPDRTQWRKVVAEAIVWCTQSTVSVKILMMMKMRRINAKYNWLKIKLKTGYIEFARLEYYVNPAGLTKPDPPG